MHGILLKHSSIFFSTKVFYYLILDQSNMKAPFTGTFNFSLPCNTTFIPMYAVHCIHFFHQPDHATSYYTHSQPISDCNIIIKGFNQSLYSYNSNQCPSHTYIPSVSPCCITCCVWLSIVFIPLFTCPIHFLTVVSQSLLLLFFGIIPCSFYVTSFSNPVISWHSALALLFLSF